MTTVQRIAAVGLVCRDAERLIRFYADAFGCRVLHRDRVERLAVARSQLALGSQSIELLEFDTPGRPYPQALSPGDNRFQHFAVVVGDMQAAWERLRSVSGWTAISTGGPQRLPANTGRVKAFKFRDPEGHPLELLEFPAAARPAYWSGHSGELFLGIDHSALSVADPTASIEFYERLGFTLAGRTLNRGVEQQHLDGVDNPEVDVIALQPNEMPPHVELLHYRTLARRDCAALNVHDVAATRLIMEASASAVEQPDLLRDPDGHFIQLRPAAPLSQMR